jgi:hypothetical protein
MLFIPSVDVTGAHVLSVVKNIPDPGVLAITIPGPPDFPVL